MGSTCRYLVEESMICRNRVNSQADLSNSQVPLVHLEKCEVTHLPSRRCTLLLGKFLRHRVPGSVKHLKHVFIFFQSICSKLGENGSYQSKPKVCCSSANYPPWHTLDFLTIPHVVRVGKPVASQSLKTPFASYAHLQALEVPHLAMSCSYD